MSIRVILIVVAGFLVLPLFLAFQTRHERLGIDQVIQKGMTSVEQQIVR